MATVSCARSSKHCWRDSAASRTRIRHIVIAGIFPWRMVDGSLVVPMRHRVGAGFAFRGVNTKTVHVILRPRCGAQWGGRIEDVSPRRSWRCGRPA
jgi:hypothetical protein